MKVVVSMTALVAVILSEVVLNVVCVFCLWGWFLGFWLVWGFLFVCFLWGGLFAFFSSLKGILAWGGGGYNN